MDVLKALRDAETKLVGELAKIRKAISALSGSNTTAKRVGKRTGKRRVSAASRRKMAQAAKARWAKVKLQRSGQRH